jgi:hypothetical protein
MMSIRQRREPSVVGRDGRLKLVGAGLVLALLGMVRTLRGVQVVTHWTGQPVFSWGLISAGCICILLALVPISWITKAAAHHHAKDHR